MIVKGLCKAQQTSRAIDFLAYIIAKGCKPTESTYDILVQGIAYEGLTEDALELSNELYSRGIVKKSLVKKVAGKMWIKNQHER
jgi:pentatricopeptide repeat protein